MSLPDKLCCRAGSSVGGVPSCYLGGGYPIRETTLIGGAYPYRVYNSYRVGLSQVAGSVVRTGLPTLGRRSIPD